MTHALALILTSTAKAACPATTADGEPNVATSDAAGSLAKIAWREKLSADVVQRCDPYQADVRDGLWHAAGALAEALQKW